MEIDDDDLRMFEEMTKKNDEKVKQQIKKEEIVDLQVQQPFSADYYDD